GRCPSPRGDRSAHDPRPPARSAGARRRPVPRRRGRCRAHRGRRGGGSDTVIGDTAGRLHIDEAMMDEIAGLVASAKPHEVLLVVDAMAGQDAVDSAVAFQARLPLTGLVQAKADGAARGGASLWVRAVTGIPVTLVG